MKPKEKQSWTCGDCGWLNVGWSSECGRCGLESPAATRPDKKFSMPDALDEETLVDACMSYNHGFGLLCTEDQQILMGECKSWFKAIRRAIMEPVPS